MIIPRVEQNWKKLLEINNSHMPFEFIDIFGAISEPYYCLEKLLPLDRENILLDLKESLIIECEITTDCNNDNEKKLCHKIAFDILDKCKTSPRQILTTLTHLKTKI